MRASGISYVLAIVAIAQLQAAAPLPARAQAQPPGSAATAPEPAALPAEGVLTGSELETLLAPVALYPDTLLIQILVAATSPLDVVKAQNFLTANAGMEPAELQSQINAKDWDASVAVLATAFPEVLGQMADHIDWTQSVGDAMLAQSDDVMATVQVLRQQAVNTGALVSGAEQTVETDAADNVVIAPTDSQTVYVPQYQPSEVYQSLPATQASSGWSFDIGDALVSGVIAFGAVALINEIFDDNDDWDDYWGCRNCGGWGGGPIIRDPDIDIDVNGNVNIGNQIDRDKITTGDIGWKPDGNRRAQAQDRIERHRETGGATTLPLQMQPSKGDDLRAKLSEASGSPDISSGLGGAGVAAAVGAGAVVGAGGLAAINRPSKVPENLKRDAIAATGAGSKFGKVDKPSIGPGGGAGNLQRPVQAKPALAKPADKRPAVKAPAIKKAASKPALAKPQAKKAVAMKPTSGKKAKAASSRGKGPSKASGKSLKRR